MAAGSNLLQTTEAGYASLKERKQKMTINELIGELSDLADDGYGEEQVVMTADYGDHSHTIQALPIRSITEEKLVTSAYSNSGKAIAGEDDDSGEGDDSEEEVVFALGSSRRR